MGLKMVNILYIHGMGGGGDSRIPSILQECLAAVHGSHDAGLSGRVCLTVRTYDFDPEIAAGQIRGWVEELKPSLVIGESLGALQALRVRGVPLLFVSPALNAPLYFEFLAWLSLIPGVTWLFDRIYKPRDGDRQRLHFSHRRLRKYMRHRSLALENSPRAGAEGIFHAFIGIRDHYRKSGIVSVRTWKKYFGDTFSVYDGSHCMEDDFVRTVLFERMLEVLEINK